MPSSSAPIQKDQRQCPAMMLAPQASQAVAEFTADFVAPAPVVHAVAVLPAGPTDWVTPEIALQHSPPDLYLLNSTRLV